FSEAIIKAFMPLLLAALTSAPLSSSAFTASSLPPWQASISAVQPDLSLALTLAPMPINRWTAATSPRIAARLKSSLTPAMAPAAHSSTETAVTVAAALHLKPPEYISLHLHDKWGSSKQGASSRRKKAIPAPRSL